VALSLHFLSLHFLSLPLFLSSRAERRAQRDCILVRVPVTGRTVPDPAGALIRRLYKHQPGPLISLRSVCSPSLFPRAARANRPCLPTLPGRCSPEARAAAGTLASPAADAALARVRGGACGMPGSGPMHSKGRWEAGSVAAPHLHPSRAEAAPRCSAPRAVAACIQVSHHQRAALPPQSGRFSCQESFPVLGRLRPSRASV